MTAATPGSGHSENYFGDYRNFWWNRGFLELMARRLQLARHHNLLDVGCGQCHWSRLLVPYLATPCAVTGVDNDAKWIAEDPEIRAYFHQQGASFEVVEGNAQALPFADSSFDLVTCQTLLIHVPNPQKAIEEMCRVLKPGGTLLCVEPNNLVQTLVKSSYSASDDIEEVLDHVKYALICERG
ncbi:class I SAM-dependent methyltransferase, partial [Cesiribacter andamanensis]|uniref:class I SAM-dependent methyltransferase n=1 Tax=Cesiribacter andamanensis TaxID=649507 RepID=UPI0005910DA8